MAIDASIALQTRAPQFDDPLTIRAKQAQLSDLATQGQLRQFQLQGAQREQQDQMTLADIYRNAGNDPQALIQGMAQRGLGSRIPAFQEGQAKIGKATTEADAAKLKLAKDKLDIINSQWSALASNPQVTHQDAINTITALVSQGIIDQGHGAQMVQQLPGNQGMLKQFLIQKGLEGLDASKRIELLLPKTETRNMGGADQVFSTDQLTGQVTPGASFAKTATPGEVMTDARTRAEGAANRGVQMRGQDLTYKSAAEAREAAKEKAANPAQKVQDATEAIQLINQAEPLLKGSTGSYSGVAIDTLAQAFGIATPGAINAQQLKAIEGALVAKMPKMSGPQSDKDVALYRQMAAVIGDSTIPYEQKAAALGQVREIQERYAGMTPGSSNTNRKQSGAVESAPAASAAGWSIKRVP